MRQLEAKCEYAFHIGIIQYGTFLKIISAQLMAFIEKKNLGKFVEMHNLATI